MDVRIILRCDFMSWQKPSREKCPECGGYMVEKGNKLVCANEKMRLCHSFRQEERIKENKRLPKLHCYSENCMIIYVYLAIY